MIPVNVPFLSGAKQINIDLAENVVILRGSRRDMNTHLLQGEVNIVLTRPIQVSHVTIKFIGKSYSLWPEGIGARRSKYHHEKIHHKQEKVLQTFGEISKSEGVLEAGVHRWPFQFMISSSLVETIEDALSKVFYYLTATVHRVGMATNPKCRRDLLLLRIPHWSNDALVANSLPTTSITSDRHFPTCDVHLCIDTAFASSGTQFPISFTILPHVKGLFLESISVILSEKKIYRLPEFDAKRIEYNDYKITLVSVSNIADPAFLDGRTGLDLKCIKRLIHVKNAHVSLDHEPLLHRLVFDLPNCLSMNHSNTSSEIQIGHTLKIDIVLKKAGVEEPVHFETPITILDCRLKEDFHTLPMYEQVSDPVDKEKPTGFFVCPCYLDYQKKRRGSMKDWMSTRNEHHPPSYESITANPPPSIKTS